MPIIMLLVCMLLPLCIPSMSHANARRHTPTLSLHDAILLAIRENPNIQQAQLNEVMQRFAREVQQWQFHPHYSLQASYGYTDTTIAGSTLSGTVRNIEPTISLLTPVGTRLSVGANNPMAGNYNPGVSLQILQPLMRGFGRPIVEMALYNAIDSETISKLNIENALRTTVTGVINAYLDVILEENKLLIDKQALERADISIKQTKLFIKSGRRAKVELVTVEADRASSQMNIENDKNSLLQARYALFTAIGINPNSNVQLTAIDVPRLIKKYKVPSLIHAKKMILHNDIQYQTDQIMLAGAVKRNVVSAQDNTRWQLDLAVNKNVGNGSGGGKGAGINSLTNGLYNTTGATVNLTIPIDDRAAQQGLVNAKIAQREAEIALRQEKWDKETNAINGWNSIYSSERALRFAENAQKLQNKSYTINFQKYTHGLVDSLSLQTAQQQIISAQQQFIFNRVAYLKALVNLDQLIGTTLDTWNIAVNYANKEEFQ